MHGRELRLQLRDLLLDQLQLPSQDLTFCCLRFTGVSLLSLESMEFKLELLGLVLVMALGLRQTSALLLQQSHLGCCLVQFSLLLRQHNLLPPVQFALLGKADMVHLVCDELCVLVLESLSLHLEEGTTQTLHLLLHQLVGQRSLFIHKLFSLVTACRISAKAGAIFRHGAL